MRKIINYPLINRNTFGIDVKAGLFVEFENEDELLGIIPLCTDKLMLIGSGSNLLFMKDFQGTVLHSSIKGIEILHDDDKSVCLKVGSGVIWDEFVMYCVKNGWWGAENLASVPGEVGAAAVQNIGAYGEEVGDIIEQVSAISLTDGSHRVFSNEECEYGYRTSIFKKSLKGQYIITYVTFRLSKLPAPRLDYGNIRQCLQGNSDPSLVDISGAIRQIRASKLPDPAVLGNAGSFFMNPIVPENKFLEIARKYPDIPSYASSEGFRKIPAGWLIEQCGWKGKSLGPAAVHDRQALVLVNKGGATGPDVRKLADTIIASVWNEFGIQLNTEVNYIE